MISNYDENIRENSFFLRLLEEQYETVKWNYHKDLVICVPKASSLDPNTTAQCDLLDYILISKNNNSYTSMNDDIVTIADEQMVLGTNSEKNTIKILFDETFYEKNKIKYKVLCIESYLTPMAVSHRCSSPNLTTTTDCIDFLWSDISDSNIVKKINTIARNFLAQQDDILELKSLSTLKELFQKLYEDSLAISIKHLPAIKDTARIKIAVETCMQYCCENKIFDAVATYVAVKDSALNKIIRNLQHVPLKDFNVNTEFYDHLITSKLELGKINKFYTVLEKVNSLKRTFELFSKNVCNVTASDFLQVLIYLLVKLQVNNWHANLYFLMHFHFSTSEESGQYNFLIASLEAAIEYIKSGNLAINSDLSLSTDKNSLEKLFDQIRVGNLEMVKSILNNEKNTNEMKLDLCHPLCSCDKCELALNEFKEKNYCAVNSADDIGRTPLHVACIHGNPLIVEYLLQKIKDVDQVDYLGCTPSLYASSRGHQPALLLLLYSHANLNTSDNDGNSLLHLAANNGHEHCVKALLYYAELSGQSAAVNAANNYADTALHQAAKWGYTTIVNLLLQHNAIVDIFNRKKQTALDVAHNYYIRQLLLHYSQMQRLERTRNTPPKRSMSLNACTIQDSTHKIVTQPKNLDQYKKIDRLLASVEKNDIPLTCYYLGIPNPNLSEHANPYICHPLCNCDKCSSSTSNPTPINPIKSNSLNINISNVDGYTALHIAAKYGRCEILRLLLDCGADVNVVAGKSGYTPLHLACVHQRTLVIRELVQCGGCRLNAKDNDGNTPLYYACVMEQVRIVELLLQEGACVKIKNNVGRTVEDVAQEKMLFGVLKLLQKNY